MGKSHKLELAKLAEKDPEFFKYLQENDKELLEFDSDAESEIEEDERIEEDEESKGERTPELTKEELNRWQKSLLEVGVDFFFSIVTQFYPAKLASFSTQITSRFPLCRSHE